jgi:GNAT superfamily N-acetyltransferase
MSSETARSGEVAVLEDDEDILSVLGRDPGWTAYAISDIEPPFRAHSRFVGLRGTERIEALVLLFRTPGFVSLLPYGTPEGVHRVLGSLPDLPTSVFVAFGEEHAGVLEDRFRLDVWWMHRMVASAADVAWPDPAVRTRRLTTGDLAAVETLYGHWESTFFQPMLLETGIYHGVYDRDMLVSIAGTHTRSARFRLGTIGGVFTHPEYRGRGLAKAVTAAVARSLIEEGAQLLVLNVKQDNQPALAAYRSLGFRIHRPYLEGHAYRRDG